MNHILEEVKLHYIWVKLKTTNPSRILLKLFKMNIPVTEVMYQTNDIQFRILKSDFKNLKKLSGYKFQVVRESGIYYLKNKIKTKHLILSGFILFLMLVCFLSQFIIRIDVIHANKDVRNLVSNALEDRGIKRFTFKKSYRALEEIKKSILKEYPNQLEWLEINRIGMNYRIEIEERIKTIPEVKKNYCHIVATKSGIVRNVIYSIGNSLVSNNDFVSSGDILISGDIVANETIKTSVCATGSVYGEVWYQTKVTLPKTFEESVKTGKKRWNFMISKNNQDLTIFRPRLNEYSNKKHRLFSIFGYEFSFLVQEEVVKTTFTYSDEEALEKGLSLVKETFQMKLSKKERIMDQKVLKKSVNNSTMELEVFVSVLEDISKQEEFQLIEEGKKDDT